MSVSAPLDEFMAYDGPDEAVLADRENRLLALFREFSQQLGVDWGNVVYSKHRLRSVISRVEKRRVYFHVFHDKMKMGELNEACLICFWILKLYPFFDVKDPDNNINRSLAIRVFLDAVEYTAKKRGCATNFSDDVLDHLIYAFTYRDLSKESLMAIAESLIHQPTDQED